jgi:myosin heavy subunit
MESHGQYHVNQAVYFLHAQESWVRGVIKEIKEVPKKGGQTEVVFTVQALQNSTLLPSFSANPACALVTPLRDDEIHPVVGDAALASISSSGDALDFDASGADTFSDLLDLSYLHDSTLLDQVRRRYFSHLIYTHIGPIVLALNPYDYTLRNYTDENMPKYFAEGDAVVTRKSDNLPHAWTTAHYAYWLMSTNRRNQSVIVSGESGAGKTETAKIVVKYLGKVSTSLCSAEQRQEAQQVTERVNLTSPILEAFGNAKTRMNDNSSRFGKFMKVFFNVRPTGGVMIGAAIEVYLLEKSRIITHGSGERGYHSFYQLLAAKSADKKKLKMDLCLDDADKYPSLNVGQATVIPGVDDADDFDVVVKAMAAVGLSENEQSSVWKVIAGIVQFLGFQFKAITDDECALDREATGATKIAAFTSSLSVELGPLEKELTVTNALIRGELIPKKLRKAQAIDLRDAIAKSLYEALFLWLVAKINTLIAPSATSSTADGWIALLDIFGFENFAHGNSFEQLCINLANETLQNHYNNIIFTRDMEECKAEGINTASVQFYDNQVCLDLVCGVSFSQCGPGGSAVVTNKLSIMHLLDEESALSNGTDQSFCDKIVAKYNSQADGPGSPKGKADAGPSGHPNFSKPKTQNNAFVIKHYAGEVKYTVDGFRNKNLDTTKETLKDVFRQSSNPFVAQLMGDAKSAAANKQTVGTFYKQQLVRLMSEINSAHPHWIRCVKPHSAKKPRMFHGMEVMTQLRSAGVLETVRIRQQSFSVRTPFEEFLLQFKLVLASIPACLMPVKGAPRQEAFLEPGLEARCVEVLRRSNCSHHSLAQVGKTKVFMRTEGFYKLSNNLKALRAGLARVVQGYARAYAAGRRARCLQLNKHLRMISACLAVRPSQSIMRRIEVRRLEEYLLITFRSILLLQSDETKVRGEEREQEEQRARETILQQSRQSLQRLRAQWEEAKRIRDDHHRQLICNGEQAQRSDLSDAESVARRLLVSFFSLSQEEENRRDSIVLQERRDRDTGLVTQSITLREKFAAYLRSVHEARLAAWALSESSSRSEIEEHQLCLFQLTFAAGRQLFAAEDFRRHDLREQQSRDWAAIQSAADSAWAGVRARWWQEKAQRDLREAAEVVKSERSRRSALHFEHEQLLIALLELSASMEQDAVDRQEARLAEQAMAELRHQEAEEARQRAEQQRALDEQRRQAQLIWMRAKAEETRLAQIAACEKQQRDLRRQQAELSKEYALECRKKEAAGGSFLPSRLATLAQYEKFRQKQQAINAALADSEKELEALKKQSPSKIVASRAGSSHSLDRSVSPTHADPSMQPPQTQAAGSGQQQPCHSVTVSSTMELLEKLSWTKLKPYSAQACGRQRNKAVTDHFTMNEVHDAAAPSVGGVGAMTKTTSRLSAYHKAKLEREQDRSVTYAVAAAELRRRVAFSAEKIPSSSSAPEAPHDDMSPSPAQPPAVTFSYPAGPAAFSQPSSGAFLRSPQRPPVRQHVVASINPFSPNWRPPEADEASGRLKAFLPDGTAVLIDSLGPARAAAAQAESVTVIEMQTDL